MKVAEKCAGCLLLGEFHDMGGTTPVCLRHTILRDAIEAHKSTEPCEWFVTLEDVAATKTQKINKTLIKLREISSIIERSTKNACYNLEKLRAYFVKESIKNENPCRNCIHDTVCGNRTHEDEICDDYTELCHCSECAYNYGLRNGLDFSEDDIVCSLWDSDGFTERDFCSHGKRLDSLSREELLEIMDYEEIEKFKKRENAKDGLSAHVTIIDELHTLKDKE